MVRPQGSAGKQPNLHLLGGEEKEKPGVWAPSNVLPDQAALPNEGISSARPLTVYSETEKFPHVTR